MPTVLIPSDVDCFNCHADSGRNKPFADPFYQSSRKSQQPKYYMKPMNINRDLRDRIAWCTANCGGEVLLEREHPVMDAMIAYIEWLGEGITDPAMQEGWPLTPGISRKPIVGWLDMQADPNKGRRIYNNNCAKCHSKAGHGPGELDKRIPPLWGDDAVKRPQSMDTSHRKGYPFRPFLLWADKKCAGC